MKKIENYLIDKKYWKRLNIDSLRLILKESSILLAETQESIKSITNKSNDLFKIILVALFAIIGFISTTDNKNIFLFVSAIYSVLVLIIAIMILYKIIYPKLSALSGSEPEKLIQDNILAGDQIQNEKMIYFIRIQSTQRAIDKNNKIHLDTFSKYKTTLIFIISSVAIYFIFFLLYHLDLTPFLDM